MKTALQNDNQHNSTSLGNLFCFLYPCSFTKVSIPIFTSIVKKIKPSPRNGKSKEDVKSKETEDSRPKHK
jgi:hypothetical protein